ncbi:MAG: DUF1572 domain-containing protein [Bacteroidia bacterium]|nr:DinB family protein [Bacteroidia bacterium]NNC84690.1 DUF1572 domain-containing protein [Bacteroidia bacterium]NNM15995.1 DUF1572 domain-containing protein [Bacteroidia bacterium]
MPQELAKHLKQVFFGGNWTSSNLKDTLVDVTWQEAATKVHSLNTITQLVYHIHYFIIAVTNVLEGKELNSKDEQSFSHSAVQNEDDWQTMIKQTLSDAEKLSALIERLPDNELNSTFVKEEYGSYNRNLLGIIEHTHYHLGQIVLIKRMIKSGIKV